jgi:hypothetical protein
VGETIYTHPHPAGGISRVLPGAKTVVFRQRDGHNITLDTEHFETLEGALRRACAVEKTGALVELFQDDNPTPLMDFTQVSAWCRASYNPLNNFS